VACGHFGARTVPEPPYLFIFFFKKRMELQQLPSRGKPALFQFFTYGRLVRVDLPPPVTPAMKWRNVASPSRNFNGSRAGDPGAISGRAHNRRTTNQPTRQAVSNPNTGQRTTPAAMISHCALIETLPMA
jgi:hypothetical protein